MLENKPPDKVVRIIDDVSESGFMRLMGILLFGDEHWTRGTIIQPIIEKLEY